MRDCKYKDQCWLGGGYNYCQTATCSEPLIEKSKTRPSPIRLIPTEENRADCTVVKVQKRTVTVQGELF